LRIALASVATLLLALPALWGGLALWYRLPGRKPAKVLGIGVWAAFSIAMVIVQWLGAVAAGLGGFALAFAAVVLWWTRLAPSNDGLWADDVAQMTRGEIDGPHVTLHNVRNFDWRTKTDYTQRWETRRYDLDKLRSADMIMSYWGLPAIAHMLMSFGFEDGSYVVFSVETRPQTKQTFSEIGGFFKEFELSILACDERDVIRVRTNVRGEEVYLYQLRMPLSAMRSLFLGYVAEANALLVKPRFYNTITVNCTTLVYLMMKRIVGHLPLDYRLLLSGHLPEYVYRVNGLNRAFSLDELRSRGRITERAKSSDRSPHFSADIRRGLPGVDLPPA